MEIKNIVFDIGNVLVKWAPFEVINNIFHEWDPKEFYQRLRPIWLDLNLGKLSELEAINLYNTNFGLSKEKLSKLMLEFKIHQTPLEGSIQLLEKLKTLNIPLFAITDNLKEIMDYHRKNSDFLKYFIDIIVSADIGIMKPDPRIYNYLIDKHQLNPRESVFIDDLLPNVNGAIAVGMNAFQFTDIESCKKQLSKLIKVDL